MLPTRNDEEPCLLTSGDKAQVEGGAGVPLDGVAGAPGGRRHVRHGRGVGGCQVLLGGEDVRAEEDGRALGADGAARRGRLRAVRARPLAGLRRRRQHHCRHGGCDGEGGSIG